MSKAERSCSSCLSLASCVLAWLCVGPTRAHDGAGLSARDWTHSWTPNLWLFALLGGASLLYLQGRRAQRRARRADHAPRQLENAAFVLSLLTLLFALASPLDRLSDLTFSAHMAQHELLMLLAAPLLVLARPLPTYLRALPAPARLGIARLLRQPVALASFRFLTAPLVALLLHGLVRWLWHIPALFEAALADEWVHGVQHASFFLTALLFWWGLVHGRYGRAGYGLSFLFVLLTAMHTGALGALLSFSEHAWYPTYRARSQPLELDPVFDQQVAGLIMWVGAGLWMMLLALALFLAWLGEARRRSERGSLAALARRAHREGAAAP
ncbi:MAG: hypothetical protein JWN04_5848 [Myxococcaceae bacterium]|nr:hypothetical protein [Myxococcaceae bacterium]